MKANKPIILNIPALFIQALDNHLKANQPRFKYDVIYFYYIVHYILLEQIKNRNRNENEDGQYVPVNRVFLKSVTVSNIFDYIKYLRNGKFIISDNHYIIGKKSNGYSINPIYLKGIDKIEVKGDCKLFNKIIKNQRRKRAHYNRFEAFLKCMYDEFMKVDLDYQKAEEWILCQPDEVKQNAYMIALSLLKDKRLRYFDRNKTNNRLDTNLTNLKKELRKFIIGDYVNIDLKNSQPFFLSMLLKSIIIQGNKQQGPLCCLFHYSILVKSFGIKSLQAISKIHHFKEKPFLVNLRAFNKSVINGTLYNDFIKSYPKGISRDNVKIIMFKVLFSNNKIKDKYKDFIPWEKDKEVFASVYPFIYESIKILKSKGHAILPVFLQKVESYIFIDCIAKELVRAGIVPLTVHDSVIVKAEHKERTIEIINKIFMENFNVIPTLDISSCC
jgi:hypothetical protein